MYNLLRKVIGSEISDCPLWKILCVKELASHFGRYGCYFFLWLSKYDRAAKITNNKVKIQLYNLIILHIEQMFNLHARKIPESPA